MPVGLCKGVTETWKLGGIGMVWLQRGGKKDRDLQREDNEVESQRLGLKILCSVLGERSRAYVSGSHPFQNLGNPCAPVGSTRHTYACVRFTFLPHGVPEWLEVRSVVRSQASIHRVTGLRNASLASVMFQKSETVL